MKRRVVITGLGAVTALGEGAAPLWEAALAGRSGIDRVSGFGKEWNPLGAAVRDFPPEKYITQRKALKVMARDIQLAVAAASLALDDAKAPAGGAGRDRFGVIVGSGVLNHELDELALSVRASLDADGRLDLKKFGEEGLSALFPLWLLKYLPNMPACHISILFDLQGPNNTITTGASAGLQAVGEAFRIIQRGAAEVMLAGGAESKLNPVGYSQYQILGVLVRDLGGDPKKVYRPFDRESEGFVIGEGSAFLVLEDREHAVRRNARIYAEIAGFGSSSNTGRKTAMKTALAEAGVSPRQIAYVQASGLGLPEEDLLEASAIEEVFNGASTGLAVSASKPVTGFTGFSAGAMDLVISTLAVYHEIIPPLLNLETPRRPWSFEWARKPASRNMGHAVTNAFGLNGQCASLVTKKTAAGDPHER